jgi:hypothetical protein
MEARIEAGVRCDMVVGIGVSGYEKGSAKSEESQLAQGMRKVGSVREREQEWGRRKEKYGARVEIK